MKCFLIHGEKKTHRHKEYGIFGCVSIPCIFIKMDSRDIFTDSSQYKNAILQLRFSCAMRNELDH